MGINDRCTCDEGWAGNPAYRPPCPVHREHQKIDRLETKIIVLKAQLAETQRRLKGVEKLVDRARVALVAFMEGTLVDDIELMDDLNDFLRPIPAAEPEMVLVKRKNLEKVIDFMENTAGTYWIEICNRLKDDLEKSHDNQ